MSVTAEPQAASRPRSVTHPDVHLLNNAHRARGLLRGLANRQRPLFVCVAAYTATVSIPGVSAAGATPALRELTATADLEALAYGRPRCMETVPGNPAGAPGPVVITNAALRLARIPWLAVDAGLNRAPDMPHISLRGAPGRGMLTGLAVDNPERLFEQGWLLGHQLAAMADYLVVAETVPGGTTTALAMLLALGISAEDRVSSSLPSGSHERKNETVRRAFARAGVAPGDLRHHPLSAVGLFGDPMQPVLAGIVGSASIEGPVVLAGGTQLLAVGALLEAVSRAKGLPYRADRLLVATTRWVAEDVGADFVGLAREVGDIPAVAADLDFGASRLPTLRHYEQGYVREGVGAGGASLAAMLKCNVSSADILAEVETICLSMDHNRLECADA